MNAPASDLNVSLIRELRDALCLAHTYVAAIADGKQPAISAEGRRIAAERLEQIDGALADAFEYMGRV